MSTTQYQPGIGRYPDSELLADALEWLPEELADALLELLPEEPLDELLELLELPEELELLAELELLGQLKQDGHEEDASAVASTRTLSSA